MQEPHQLQIEVNKINNLARSTNKKIIHNPYTKKFQWTSLQTSNANS